MRGGERHDRGDRRADGAAFAQPHEVHLARGDLRRGRSLERSHVDVERPRAVLFGDDHARRRAPERARDPSPVVLLVGGDRVDGDDQAFANAVTERAGHEPNERHRARAADAHDVVLVSRRIHRIVLHQPVGQRRSAE